LVWAVVAKPVAAADAAHGAELFKTCAACHSDRPGALGPDLQGVVDRPAGSLPSFRYSGPMSRSGVVWTEGALRAFLKAPQTVIKGNRMPFGGFDEPEDIDDVIAYLKARGGPSAPTH
jgi:cytochrome c